jgi:acetyltransferase-like isoleucine patch superfamily enzyme
MSITPRAVKWIWHHLYRIYGVRHGVTLGRNVHLGLGTILDAPHHFIVEDEVYIGKSCTIECDGRIGAHSMLANQVGLVGRHDHDIDVVGESVRHAPWIGDDNYKGPGLSEAVIVGPDVWIGFGSIILSGTHIGRGAIVAAGSIVLRDVPPYSVVAGCPAAIKAIRFSPCDIEAHERMLSIKYGIPIGDDWPA